jgi:iron complex outermembrane receptor protein
MKLKKSSILTPLALAISTALSLNTFAYAEDNETASNKEKTVIEVIEVTAQKRTQSIQSVAASISAISGDSLTKGNMSNIVDMSDMIPNVQIAGQGGLPNIYMRGIGSGVNFAFEQSIAQFKDDIYQGRAVLARSPVFDIERIEVMKGTQSIMFGKNATAGAINTTTRNATSGTRGFLNIGIGSLNERKLEGAFNTDINDNWSARVSIIDKSVDGFMTNDYDGDHIGAIDKTGLRLALHGDITNNLSLDFKVEHNKSSVDDTIRQYEVDTEQLEDALNAGYPGGLVNTLLFSGPLDTHSYYSEPTGQQKPWSDELTSDTAVLKLDYQLGENTLTSITSYTDYIWEYSYEPTYSEQTWLALQRDEDFNQITQEFRIVSPVGDFFDYIAGVYFTKQTLKLEQSVDIYDFVAVPIPQAGFGLLSDFSQDTSSYAAFVSLGFQLSEKLKATLGLRYDSETKEVDTTQTTYSEDFGYPQSVSLGIADSVMANLGAGNLDLKDKRKKSNVSPGVTLTYQANDDLMTYASWKIGYKGGGFDGSLANGSGILGSVDENGNPHNHSNPATKPNDAFEFKEEKATAYELGFKSTILDGIGQFNMAYYHTTYEDQQVSTWNGNAYVVNNASEAEIQGIEIESIFMLTDSLTLVVNGAWSDFEFSDYKEGPATVWQQKIDGTLTQDLTGRTGLFAPDYTAFISLNHEYNITDNWLLESNINMSYSSELYTSSDLDEASKQDAYSKVNLRFSLLDINNDNWSFTLLIKNLTEETVMRTSQDMPATAFAYWASIDNPERNYSFTATYQF